jgi:hypothetical protein
VKAEAKVAHSLGTLVPALMVDPDLLPLPFNTLLGVDLRTRPASPILQP